jgi:predicted ester cyclase
MPIHPIATRWFEEVWNQANEAASLAAVDELFLPEGLCYGFPEPGSVIGRDGFKATVLQFRSAFSAIHVTVDDTITEGDKVAMRWTARMQHTGAGLGIAPTSQPVTLTGISTMHLRDGRILEGWNALDMTAVVARLNAQAAG